MAEYLEISNAEYRKKEGLASSDIKRMMKSFATWKYFKDHPEEDKDTPSLKFGRACHKFILEPFDFDNEFIIKPKVDGRTAEGKKINAKFEQDAVGKEIITEETYDKLVDMRDMLYKTPYVKKLLSGEHEKSFFWKDAETGIVCKCRPDSYGVFGSQNVIVDYKTCQNAETNTFMRDAIKYSYDVQAAHYTAGLEEIYGKDYTFIFIAQEVKPPYLVNVLQADAFFMENGQDVRNTMLRTYKKCLELDEYPAYLGFKDDKTFFNELSVPAWLKNAMEYENDDTESEE